MAFDKVNEWVELIRQNAPPDILICMCGNKVDLDDIAITFAQGKKRAQELCVCSFSEVSAKENTGLNELMIEIASKVLIVQSASDKLEVKTFAESINKRTHSERFGSTVNQSHHSVRNEDKKCPCNIF